MRAIFGVIFIKEGNFKSQSLNYLFFKKNWTLLVIEQTQIVPMLLTGEESREKEEDEIDEDAIEVQSDDEESVESSETVIID